MGFKGKDHSSSRKKTSKERKLESSEEGAPKESETGCNMTQNQQFNPILPEKVAELHAPVNNLFSASFSTFIGEGGKEEGTHQPQS